MLFRNPIYIPNTYWPSDNFYPHHKIYNILTLFFNNFKIIFMNEYDKILVNKVKPPWQLHGGSMIFPL